MLYPLITRDPASGGELIVTRLECPTSGVVIEGRFSLGWIAKLTPDQLDFVGVLLQYRNNIQKIANDLGVAYNTARSRLDDIVAAVGGDTDVEPRQVAIQQRAALDALAAGDLTFDEALTALKSTGGARS